MSSKEELLARISQIEKDLETLKFEKFRVFKELAELECPLEVGQEITICGRWNFGKKGVVTGILPYDHSLSTTSGWMARGTVVGEKDKTFIFTSKEYAKHRKGAENE